MRKRPQRRKRAGPAGTPRRSRPLWKKAVILFNLYEGLVKPTSTGDLMPAVASGYTVSDDAKVYTCTLRDGITFHDGTPVTIEDVKYSIDRYAEIQGESSAFSIVADASVRDEKTIEVTLKESYSEFLPMTSKVFTQDWVRALFFCVIIRLPLSAQIVISV